MKKVKNKSSQKQILNPLAKSLSGIIKPEPDFDFKKEHGNYLVKKY